MAGLLTVSTNRMEAVDFSYPLQSVGPVIVLKKPPVEKFSLKDSVFKLLEPFEFSIWLMSFLGKYNYTPTLSVLTINMLFLGTAWPLYTVSRNSFGMYVDHLV